jgi:hypothetical protein
MPFSGTALAFRSVLTAVNANPCGSRYYRVDATDALLGVARDARNCARRTGP